MIVFEQQIKFRILCDYEISADVSNFILKKLLDSETDFKPYCDNYVIKVEKQPIEDFKEVIVDEFSKLNPLTFYCKLIPL